jgi:hypothetical protein
MICPSSLPSGVRSFCCCFCTFSDVNENAFSAAFAFSTLSLAVGLGVVGVSLPFVIWLCLLVGLGLFCSFFPGMTCDVSGGLGFS